MKAAMSIGAALLALTGLALTAALWLGGPGSVAPLDSINAPFKSVDFSQLPPAQRYVARDGAALAYRHYAPAPGAVALHRRVVLIHGSSASSHSMHPLAQALAAAGFEVDALDVRGHGDSGERGHIATVGQLEDDLQDFMQSRTDKLPTTLVGLSAGGGLTLRFAGDARQNLFERYVLLSPFLHQDAPTRRQGLDGWVSIGVPRIVALTLLNRIDITAFNDLPVTNFALDEASKKMLTPSYDYSLATNFRPHMDYVADIRAARQPMQVIVGSEDELFLPDRFASVFAVAPRPVPVTLIPGVNHIGISLAPNALQAVVKACLN